MDKIEITGGTLLKGTIDISGAKNAALPLMAASLLTEETLTLSNVPHLSDITTMANLLVHHGMMLTVMSNKADDGHHGRVVTLNASNIVDTTAPYEIVRKMRASVVVLGPLLARFGRAKVSLPGGCAIGARPIDLHLKALEAMGAKIALKEGYIEAEAPDGLRGAEIAFEKVSVGATENILMAATLAKGVTVLHNAAQEPEIGDLAHCLNAMGAKIEGIDTDTLTITGVDKLHGVEYKVLPDRIEAGSYAIAAVITGGEIRLEGIQAGIMQATLDVLEAVGADIKIYKNAISVKGKGRIQPVDMVTAPYPGLATDMQAQLTALMCLADGTSTLTETIFENRFMHVPELHRMGADITIDGNQITIKGVKKLKGAEVMATDLRASLSLVLAGLAARGTTVINRVYHIDRGYERVGEKLRGCGANIHRMRD